MKKNLVFVFAVLTLLMIPLVSMSHAEIGNYDFSSPKDGDVDGKDLAALIASPGPDIAAFAGFFGQTYTITTRKPNILLIIADDVGVDVTSNLYPGLIDQLQGMYPGEPVTGRPASLPVLTDRLATQGMVFRNAWSQPYCSPARATIITGLFEDKTRVTGVTGPESALKTTHTTFVQLLKEAGYSTALFGKWHLGGSNPGTSGALPKQVGFDYYRGHNGAVISGYWSYPVHWQDGNTNPATFNTTAAGSVDARSLPGIVSTKYAPVVKGADTIDWINARTNENRDKPWFVWLAFNLSHAAGNPMMHVPNADTLDTESYNEMVSCGAGFTSNPPQIGSCNGKQMMRAMTNAMDTVIGKVLDVVDNLDSDTYVIFIGDNGTPMYGGTYGDQIDNMYIYNPLSSHGKGSAYEGGCHVPMAIRGPGIAAGVQKSAPVHVADLFATILTMVGLTPPAQNFDSTGAPVDSDSKSLTPILFGSANDTGRDPNAGYLLTETTCTDWGNILVGARNATYKVLCNTSKSTCYFYNLVTDPLEQNMLTKPSSCPATCSGIPCTPENQEWHYCRLMEVINTYSILSP